MATNKSRRKSRPIDYGQPQPADYERARRLVDAAVAQHAEAWAAKIGLTPCDQFRNDVNEALYECTREHIVAPLVSIEHEKIRKRKAAAVAVATSVAKKLRSARTTPASFPPLWSDFQLFSMEHDLKRVVEAERQRGCRPPAMLAFTALARGLAQALQNATGQPATVGFWNAYRERYQGKLLDVVEIMLPTAREIAEAVTGRPLAAPETVAARSKFLQRLTPFSPEDKTHHK